MVKQDEGHKSHNPDVVKNPNPSFYSMLEQGRDIV